ncbi:hypothetical protein PBAL39_00682 [Pedobacter sp. BAL39]|uniref:hypothetical protein n=1 Tax=Pedobacter sp. BAL39 TaxID=391596 RepID=UPI0001559C8D|nr:hypothetical protein [Pedobacter sp. BAL39]EDM38085.1 hypothetical protein PBAL39_00682 [Pedobacter sp. BAL39]
MRTNAILILLSFISIFLTSCGPSELSETGIGDLGLIRANISVNQDLLAEGKGYVVASLDDPKGREIRNDSIKILVNDKLLNFHVIQGLYYTSNSVYVLEEVMPENHRYKVDIVLSNGKRYHLAEIPALKVSAAPEIIYNEKPDLNSDFTIQWKGLADVNLLNIGRSVKLRKSEGPNITTYAEQSGDTIKVNQTGSHVIPISKLSDTTGTVSILSLDFIAEKHGVLNRNLFKGSSAVIVGKIERTAHFKE